MGGDEHIGYGGHGDHAGHSGRSGHGKQAVFEWRLGRDEGFFLPMSVGAILMPISAIVVALNAQLLRRLDLRPEESVATSR